MEINLYTPLKGFGFQLEIQQINLKLKEISYTMNSLGNKLIFFGDHFVHSPRGVGFQPEIQQKIKLKTKANILYHEFQ